LGKQGSITEFEAGPDDLISPDERALPPWDLYTVCVCLLSGYILIPLMLSNMLLLIDPFMDQAQQMFIEQSVTLLTWLSIFGVLQWRYGHLAKYIGLSFTKARQYYLWETTLLLVVSNGLTLGLSLFWMLLEKLQPELHLGADPYADFSGSRLWVLFFFAVIVAPLQEELIFRGLVQSTLHKVCNRFWSVLWTGLVFLLLHGSYMHNIKAMAHVVVLGLCFGIWRERTRSLVPGMVAHGLNNGLASLMMFSKHWH
jgi:membrane protease YdiL (CAAX protease family)